MVLLVDTFNRYFEPENARAAIRVLQAAGYRVHVAHRSDGGRPLCCGRTFLSAGLVDEARVEAQRMLAALAPWVARGMPIIGLEPSCLFTLRDEYGVLLPGTEALAKQRLPVRGIPRQRSRGRPPQAEAQADRAGGAAARPLPPEGVRRDGRGGAASCAWCPG